ncbi:MAG: alanyl-tRNA editing protein [Acidobacteriota bacterium]
MTTRLYYTEPYRADFEATVVSCTRQGDRIEARLDRTAFYPTSGGQPFDTGRLGGARVVNVEEDDAGDVVHVLDAPLDPGARVQGAIDWTRRFDHMQQHSGQHVLSAAFDAVAKARTESFHLGAASSTIDLGRDVGPPEIAAAEDEANRIVWEDRPVAIRFVTAEDAAALPLRKETLRTGRVRLIDVEGFDLSACGGTHVARTGAIGVIAVAGWEKFRGGTRVEFVCGGRALAGFRRWRDAFAASARVLSVAPEELAAGIERLQAENKALQRRLRGLQEQLAAHEARALVARAAPAGRHLAVVEALEGWDAQGLKALAVAAAAAEPAAAVVLFTIADPALAVVASGTGSRVDAAAILTALVAAFGGKGGGKRDLAQGGGLRAAGGPGELVAAARALVASA